ncbi:MAG: hypothetical protein ACTSQ8_24205, partial [Candidatus Helarchaeota archaeon]
RAWAKQLISNQKNTSKEAIAIILLPLTFGICAIWLGIGGYVEIPANYLKSPEKAVSVRNSGTLDENVCGLDVVNCDNTKPITAYSEFDSCHTGDSCLMASGNKAYIGAIACPRDIKLYTRVVIDGIPYVCEDRTSIKYDGRFDIFMGYGERAYEEAIQYGIQYREVWIQKNTV